MQSDPDAAEFVAYIVDGVERMSSLIHDLLQYSSTGASKTLPTAPTSAEGALAEVLFALSASIDASGAAITYDPSSRGLGGKPLADHAAAESDR